MKCSFCLKERKDKECIVSEEAVICSFCADFSVKHFNKEESQSNTSELSHKPHFLKSYLDKYVVGQNDAKKMLCLNIFSHISRVNGLLNAKKPTLLMAGPSGSGKTYMIEVLLKSLKVPYTIADATTLTVAGFVGRDVDDVIRDLYLAANMNIKNTEKGIVVIDEVDKLTERVSNDRSSIGTVGVQQELLKLIEGRKVDMSSPRNVYQNKKYGDDVVNTGNITFIFIGAFPGLYENIRKRKSAFTYGKIDSTQLVSSVTPQDIVEYGFIEEFVGRMTSIAALDVLTNSDLKNILLNTEVPVFSGFVKYFGMFDIELTISDEGANCVVALSNGNLFGARALHNTLTSILQYAMFDAEVIKGKGHKKIILDVENNRPTLRYM